MAGKWQRESANLLIIHGALQPSTPRQTFILFPPSPVEDPIDQMEPETAADLHSQ